MSSLGNVFGELATPGNARLLIRTFFIHVDLGNFFQIVRTIQLEVRFTSYGSRFIEVIFLRMLYHTVRNTLMLKVLVTFLESWQLQATLAC